MSADELPNPEAHLRDGVVTVAKGLVSELVPGGGLIAEALGWAASRRQVAYWRGLEARLNVVEQAMEDLTQDDARVMLVADGWRRARIALREDHAEAMGRVVGAALSTDPSETDRLTVDRASILLRLLDELQPLHLAVLSCLERPYPARTGGLPEGATQKGGLSAEALASMLDGDPSEIRWVLTDLSRHGLIRYSDRSEDGISYNLGPPTADALSLGRDLLRHLPDGTQDED